jgi:hypothetical protein
MDLKKSFFKYFLQIQEMPLRHCHDKVSTENADSSHVYTIYIEGLY